MTRKKARRTQDRAPAAAEGKAPEADSAPGPAPEPPLEPAGRDLMAWGLFALPTALVGLFSTHTLTSIYQDIGRHLTLGRIIWETKSIPTTNLFSFTNPDFPFINHHWLSEVALYAGSQVVGLKGLIVLKALMLASAFGLALAATGKPDHRLFRPSLPSWRS